jgi:hypothetical protein
MVSYTIWSRIAASTTALAWDELSSGIESRNVAKLSQVLEDYPNSNAAHMAALVLADNHLADGCDRLFVNKPTAMSALGKATELYDAVRENCRIESFIERATFGMARASEAKGDGESLHAAEQLYAEIGKRWPKGAFAAEASQRLSDLKRPAIKEMYARFVKFDPKPAFTPEPGKRPDFNMDSLPEEDSSYMPKTTFDLKLDKGKGKSTLPPIKVEAAEKAKPEPKEKSAENPKEEPKAQPKPQPKEQPKGK